MRSYLLLLLALAVGAAWSMDLSVPVSDYARRGLDGWKTESFSGETDYAVVRLNDRPAVQATSRKAASALYKEIEIDLVKTPYLNWAWRVDNVINGFDEKTRAGDDFAARVYVVVKDGLFPWQAKALNYVWSNTNERGAVWRNPYASDSIMIALRAGAEGLGSWQTEKVNVAEDLRQAFGREIRYVHGVAIMTDTDNTGSEATAFYGDIIFTTR